MGAEPDLQIPAYLRRGEDPWRGTGAGRVQPRTAVEPHPALSLADVQPNPTWPQAPRHLNEVERGDTLLETNRPLAELLLEVRNLRLAVQRGIDRANAQAGGR